MAKQTAQSLSLTSHHQGITQETEPLNEEPAAVLDMADQVRVAERWPGALKSEMFNCFLYTRPGTAITFHTRLAGAACRDSRWNHSMPKTFVVLLLTLLTLPPAALLLAQQGRGPSRDAT